MSLSYMGSSHSGRTLSHYCKRALREIFGSWWVHPSVCTKVHVSMSTAPPLCDMPPYSEINRENKNNKSVLKLARQVREEGCFPQLVSGSGFYTETESESVKQQKQLAPECLSILGNPEHVRVSWYHSPSPVLNFISERKHGRDTHGTSSVSVHCTTAQGSSCPLV